MLAKKNYTQGLVAALSCMIIWGLLPLYWKSLIPINSFVIIFYRIFTVGIVCFFASLKLYGFQRMTAPLKNKKHLGLYILAGIIVTANWSLYIQAVNAGFVIQTGIGYYIEPLVVSLFGIVFFGEKSTIFRTTAFALALLGVIIMIIHFRQIPTIALGLAFSFGIYAALKKSFHLEPLLSLLYETMFLTPIAFAVILYLELNGKGALGHCQPYQYILLLASGFMTAIPLGLFAIAANNLPLMTVGITVYISPTIALLLGIFVFKEAFDFVHFISVCVIWVGLIMFTIGEIRNAKIHSSS